MARAGHDVYLIAPTGQDKMKDGVQILAVDPPRNRWVRFTSTSTSVTRRARQIPADAYHVHDPELLPWCAVQLRDAPVVYDMHEDIVAQIHTKDWVPDAVRSALSTIVGMSLRVFLKDRPVIFAEASYAETYDWLDHTVTVQNMPVVSELTDIDEPEFDTPMLGYIGGVRKDRGSVVTLEALHHLQKRGYKIGWQCIGPATESHQAELDRIQADRNIGGIDFLGYLPPEEGWSHMSRCHIGIAMLEKTPNFVGSYPTKLFEYMALGLPVLTSDIPMYRRVVEQADCGLVADPLNPEAVAEAIAYMLDHPNEAQAMGERGRQAVQERYSWEREADRLLEFYTDTVLS